DYNVLLDGYYTPGNLYQSQACAACIGPSEANFTFSDVNLIYGTNGPGTDSASLQFTVNFNPISNSLTSGYLTTAEITIDYNDIVFGDITNDPNFKVQ